MPGTGAAARPARPRRTWAGARTRRRLPRPGDWPTAEPRGLWSAWGCSPPSGRWRGGRPRPSCSAPPRRRCTRRGPAQRLEDWRSLAREAGVVLVECDLAVLTDASRRRLARAVEPEPAGRGRRRSGDGRRPRRHRRRRRVAGRLRGPRRGRVDARCGRRERPEGAPAASRTARGAARGGRRRSAGGPRGGEHPGHARARSRGDRAGPDRVGGEGEPGTRRRSGVAGGMGSGPRPGRLERPVPAAPEGVSGHARAEAVDRVAAALAGRIRERPGPGAAAAAPAATRRTGW